MTYILCTCGSLATINECDLEGQCNCGVVYQALSSGVIQGIQVDVESRSLVRWDVNKQRIYNNKDPFKFVESNGEMMAIIVAIDEGIEIALRVRDRLALLDQLYYRGIL